MSNERKKLLSVTNLKKYFPIAKNSIFQKEQLYVRANEDITFDVYEGETIGIVGESGCGKSTLGRVILQLYDQTAGTTMYYGKSRSEVAPHYVWDTLNNVDRYIEKYRKAQSKCRCRGMFRSGRKGDIFPASAQKSRRSQCSNGIDGRCKHHRRVCRRA